MIKIIRDLMMRRLELGNHITDPKFIWYFVKDVLFAQQIIENHKIVDFKEANKYRESIDNADPQQRIDFANNVFKKFYDKNKGQYEYYVKSIKQNE